MLFYSLLISSLVELVRNLMAHAQKPHFVFRLNAGSRGVRISVSMLDTPRSEVVWEYWLPTPFASFPFTSPPVRLRVPPHSERSITDNFPFFRPKSEFTFKCTFTYLGYFSVTCYHCGRHMQNIDWCLMVSFVLTDRGVVYACGDNKFGQCGVGNQNPTILTATAVSELHLFVFVTCSVTLVTLSLTMTRGSSNRSQENYCFTFVMLNVDIPTSGSCWWC